MVRAMPAPIRLMVFDGYQPGYGFFNSFGVLTRPLLQRGSKGPAVVELQTILEQRLQQSIGVDGDFGTRTYNAVSDFQRMSALRVDGVVGKDTWTALLGQPVQVGSGAGTTPPPPGPGTPPAPPINDGDMIIGGGGGGGGAPAGSSSKLLLALVGVTAAYFIFKK